MFTELQGLPITIEVAKQILAGHDSDTTPLTMDEILRISAEHFKIRINDLKSTNRAKPIVTARQVAMYLAKKYLNKSLMDIGRAFGGKDHSTVINAIRRIDTQQVKDSELRRDLEELQTKIDNITGV
jgi:chromosomal replication initiator protein